MSGVTLSGVKKSYGSVEVLHGIDLDIQPGEFVVFVGPSGCGKSTLLRMIAGLEEITAGTLEIDGRVVNSLTPKERGIAMVFQSYALYPHMSVYENMAFGLSLGRNTPKSEIDRRVREAAEILQITPYLDRKPKELSGGQRQRVAIGRAITRDPRVFLFDEPLSNLDAALRVATRLEIARLAERMSDTTMVYVTHDQVEAMTLADRIVVLNQGMIEQFGTPMELYRNPANLFVAKFIGSPSMNIVPGVFSPEDNGFAIALEAGERIHISRPLPGAGGPGYIGLRPEDTTLVAREGALFAGKVMMTEPLGEVTLAYVDVGREETPFVVKLPGEPNIKRGDFVFLGAEEDCLHLFDADGRRVKEMAV